MRHKLLKSLLGKHICSAMRVAYCHIDRVIIIEEHKAIVTAIVKTLNNRLVHWFVEAAWTTDDYGIHGISSYKTLREDELDGEYTTQNEVV